MREREREIVSSNRNENVTAKVKRYALNCSPHFHFCSVACCDRCKNRYKRARAQVDGITRKDGTSTSSCSHKRSSSQTPSLPRSLRQAVAVLRGSKLCTRFQERSLRDSPPCLVSVPPGSGCSCGSPCLRPVHSHFSETALCHRIQQQGSEHIQGGCCFYWHK